MQINRAEFLQALSQVKPGLSSKDRVDQSSSVIFSNGHIMTYNEQQMVMLPWDMDFEGAVRAEELIGILNKLSSETIDMTTADGQVVIRAGKSKAGIRFENEVRLPVEEVLREYEQLDQSAMVPMSDALLSAFQRARFCAAQNTNDMRLTGLQVKSGIVTATDNFRIIKVQVAGKGLKKLPEFILPASCIEALSSYAISHLGISGSWAFFTDEHGLLFCVRLIATGEPFPEVDALFDVEGPELSLPSGLVDAIDKTTVFTKSLPHETDKMVSVIVKPGRVTLRGAGVFGWYEESVPAKDYGGDPVEFFAHPEFLRAILPQVQRMVLGSRVALFEGENFTHVFALSSPAEED